MEGARKSEATPTGRVFKGVTLIKSGLGNKRDKNYYPPEALQEGVRVGLFEGLRAFADHPDSVSEEIQPERSVRDLVGVYENAQYDHGTNAVTADLRILRSHSWLSEAIDELIDAGHADKIGLSINGRGETEPTRRRLEESGEEVEVNELKKFIELRSTDVVTEAGAGGGFAQLVESARRAKVVQESAPMKKSIVLANLREAVRTGNFAEAKKLEKAIDTAEDDTQEAAGDEDGDEKPGRKTKEMGAFGAAGKMKGKKRYAMEAADADPDAEDADDDLEEGADEDDEDEVDEDAALDEAAEAEREDADDDLEEADDEDEDEADDEGDDTREADTVPGRAKFRTREAGIIGATGKPTGKVTSGVGKFTKKARSAGGGGRLSTKTTGGFRTKGMPGKHRESAASVALVQQNRRLREHIARQDSVNLATKMLRESSLPRAVRPHVLRSLVGLTRAEMQAEINKQASILEAAASSAVERLSDDFDVVEGAGATTLRESYFGGGSDGDDLGSVLAECGLPMKR
jgi:hypothetical protein